MPNNMDFEDGIDNEAKNWLIHEPEELRDIMTDIPFSVEGNSAATRIPILKFNETNIKKRQKALFYKKSVI
ncbi:hypothetical protein [Vibrio mediterranei]|uniref:Uncharacterized protein n=1 Tax=Vibrio mediterranei TaxID=689 RepID=A0AAN1KLH9_9VIBR|nr:hypothetical protein [Vibrio mediterranei]ASI88410.1 hypothetical protein BSZ05_00510 [Vibrio mediterranei]